jgi:predicted house-cleaning noncanonical NTP pyrophosphatase (MazG superfamily)
MLGLFEKISDEEQNEFMELLKPKLRTKVTEFQQTKNAADTKDTQGLT